MSRRIKKYHRYDIDTISVLLFLLSFCVMALVFTFVDGSDAMYYSGFPFILGALLGTESFVSSYGFIEEQMASRLSHNKWSNAMVLLRSLLLLACVRGIVFFMLFFVFAEPICAALFSNRMIAPVLRTFVPSYILFSFIGCMMGFLRGMGKKQKARTSLWLETTLFFLLGLCLGFFSSYRGEMVGSLLQNEEMRAIYCGCGMAAGLDIASLITLIYLSVSCYLESSQYRYDKNERDMYLEDTLQTENVGELFQYCLIKLLPEDIPVCLFYLGILIGFQSWIQTQQDTAFVIITSVWGSFMGIGLPLVVGLALLLAFPFTAMTRKLAVDLYRGNRRTMRARLSIILRLSAYVGIPASAFMFGAAKEVVACFPNLTFKAQEAAILSLKSGSFLIFLIQTSILLILFFEDCDEKREVMYSMMAGFFAQVLAIVGIQFLDPGITIGAWSSDIFFVVFLLAMYLFEKKSLVRGLSPSWFGEDVLIAVCAAVSLIPIEWLNDYLIMVMSPYLALLVAWIIFTALYVLLSIIFRIADLKNLDRIPGGRWIVSFAILIGAASEEVE